MLKVRLARIGKKGQPMYRIVVMEARSSRNGTVVDTIGWYNPTVKENSVSIDKVKYQDWISKGAQPTDSILRFVLTDKEKLAKWPKSEKKDAKASKASEEKEA